MASTAALGPYSRVSALSCKGIELQFRGHTARSVDKLREALAAARVVGTEDCLVTAFLTVGVAERDVRLLVRLAAERPVDRLSVAAKLRECAEAVAGAAAVARRRRSARTHQPAEQAWYMAHYAAVMRGQGSSKSEALAIVKQVVASLIGLETTVLAACTTLCALEFATTLALFSASELSSRLDAACDLVDEAVALAGPQRVEGTPRFFKEALHRHLRDGVELWRQKSSTAAHAARLAEALEQLRLYSAFSAEDLARSDKDVAEGIAKMVAAQTAASSPELLRRCALATCGAKEAHVSHFSRCAACKTVVYCSKECQLADWPAHRKACKAARKAADEAKTAATAQ